MWIMLASYTAFELLSFHGILVSSIVDSKNDSFYHWKLAFLRRSRFEMYLINQ